MGKHVNQTPPPPTTARYVDPFRDKQALTPITGEERTILRTVNQKIAARPSLRAIVDYLFDHTQGLIPCDRIGLAFLDERGERVTSYYNRASYGPLAIDKDYSEALQQTSLQEVLVTGQPRIIGDLELYLKARPKSRSTKRLVREGVRSNLACPLSVEGRVVGFIFRSSRHTYEYRPRHIELQMAISERLSQAVEKAWRIEQLEASTTPTRRCSASSATSSRAPSRRWSPTPSSCRRATSATSARCSRPSSTASCAKAGTCSVSSTSTWTWRASRAWNSTPTCTRAST